MIELFSGEVDVTKVLPEIKNHIFGSARSMMVACNLMTQAGTTPTLDLAIQAKIGDYWYNLIRFSQFTTTLGMKVITLKKDFVVAASVAPTANPAVSTGELLQAQLWGDTLRVSYALGGTSPVYSFWVRAYPFNY